MHRLTGIIGLAMLPTIGMAEPWHGIWSAEADWCVNADRIGSVTPAPILLSAEEMLGYENSCVMKSVSEIGELNAWTLTVSCQSEGETYDESQLVMVDGDTLFMWWGADEPIRFTRCPQ